MTALAPLLKQISTAELGFDVFNTDNQTGYNTQFFSLKFIWKPKIGTELNLPIIFFEMSKKFRS